MYIKKLNKEYLNRFILHVVIILQDCTSSTSKTHNKIRLIMVKLVDIYNIFKMVHGLPDKKTLKFKFV